MKAFYRIELFVELSLSYSGAQKGLRAAAGRGATTDGTMLGYTITIAVISLIVSAYG